MGDQELTDGGLRVYRWGPSIDKWGTKSWQMGDQELTDGMPMVDRWGPKVDWWGTKSWQMGTKSWQMGTKSWQMGDEELTDEGPRVDRWWPKVGRWGTKSWHMLNWNLKGIRWDIKVIYLHKSLIKKMKRLSEPGHEISNKVVCATSKSSDAQSDQSRC